MKLSRALIAASNSGDSGAFLMTRDGTVPNGFALNDGSLVFITDSTHCYAVDNEYGSIYSQTSFTNGSTGTFGITGCCINNDGQLVIYGTQSDYDSTLASPTFPNRIYDSPRVIRLDPADFSQIEDTIAFRSNNTVYYGNLIASGSPATIPSTANVFILSFFLRDSSDYGSSPRHGQYNNGSNIAPGDFDLGQSFWSTDRDGAFSYTSGQLANFGAANTLFGITGKDSDGVNSDREASLRLGGSSGSSQFAGKRFRNPPSYNDEVFIWAIGGTSNVVNGDSVAYWGASGRRSGGSFGPLNIYLSSTGTSGNVTQFFTSMGFGNTTSGIAVNDTHDRIFIAVNTSAGTYIELMDDAKNSIWAYTIQGVAQPTPVGSKIAKFDWSGNILFLTNRGLMFIPSDGLRAGVTSNYSVVESTPLRGSESLVGGGLSLSSIRVDMNGNLGSMSYTATSSELTKSTI